MMQAGAFRVGLNTGSNALSTFDEVVLSDSPREPSVRHVA